MTEKFSKKDSNTETQLYQLKDDNTSLKYIISDLKKQLKQIKTENNKLKDNYNIFLTGLFEKSINVRQMYLDLQVEKINKTKNTITIKYKVNGIDYKYSIRIKEEV